MLTKLFTLVLAAGLVLAGCNTAADMSPTEPSSKSGATIQAGNGATSETYTYPWGWYTCEGKWAEGEIKVHVVRKVTEDNGTFSVQYKVNAKGRAYDEDGVKYEFIQNSEDGFTRSECEYEWSYDWRVRVIRPGGKNNEFITGTYSDRWNRCTGEWDWNYEYNSECDR